MARPRSSTTALRKLLDDAHHGFYLLDSQRILVYCNRRCAELLGVTVEELVGTQCNYHSQDTGDRTATLAAHLCPPPETFLGERQVTKVRLPAPTSRRSLVFNAECLPLGTDHTGESGVLVLLSHVDDTNLRSPDRTWHERLARAREPWIRAYRADRLVGESPAMRRVQQQVRLAIEHPTRVVITGLPGTGREHLARTIHLTHTAKPSSLFPLSCPLLTPESMQSTVSAFVDHCQREGTLDKASLLLLDIDQLSPAVQTELSGLFSIHGFHMLTIATSTQCLLSMAKEGRFNEDLALALSTLVIHLPPLSERIPDIALLAQAFLEEFNAEGDHQLTGFSDEALDRLVTHTWHGQVDELVTVVHTACNRATSHQVELHDLPDRIMATVRAESRPRRSPSPINLDHFLAEVEQELIERALAESRGNKTRAATLLGITRSRIHRRIQQHHIDQHDCPED